jgi:molybdate transport system substrate-binding protein
MSVTRRQLLGGALLGLAACRGASGRRALRGAAAADLEPAFTEVAEQFFRHTGRHVVWSFASSGQLAQQLEHGAPFDLYASANGALVERLGQRGRLVAQSRRDFARGRLALWARPGVVPPTGLTDLVRPGLGRIALANPEHAPYGQAAVAALRAAGIYEAVRPRLVFAENVRQALQFAQTGNTDIAITALTLAQRQGAYTVVPATAHPPLIQALGVIRGGDEVGATQLADFLCGAAGQAILRRHGFEPVPPDAG